jgi:hypothetical protein
MDDMAERKGADMTEEYISRKSVRDAIASLSIERFELTPAYRLYVEALDNVDKKIVKIPSADVELVKRGKFTRHVLKNANVPWGVDCSACGAWFVIGEDTAEKYNYCPNCGALMDKGVSDV